MVIIVAVGGVYRQWAITQAIRGRARQQTFVIGALVKLLHRVNVSHGRNIAKDDLVGAYAHDGAVGVEEIVDRLALAETEDMDGKPKIGDGIVPGAGYRREGREEEVVDCAHEQ